MDAKSGIPGYMVDYLDNNKSLLAFLSDTKRNVSKFKCGRKVGQRLSDAGLIWSEHWFEAWMQDVRAGELNEVRDVIVKHYSKVWINGGTRKLEGESCLQLLNDGSKSYSHDGLLFEMKDSFAMDDVSNA